MKDMLEIIYEAMLENSSISNQCDDRIKMYLYPETGDTSKPFITIRPLQPPINKNYASDKSLGCEFYVQIDTQSHDRKKCKEIQQEVRKVMIGLDFVQMQGGLDEYFEETKRFVDARRYLKTTNLYDIDY